MPGLGFIGFYTKINRFRCSLYSLLADVLRQRGSKDELSHNQIPITLGSNTHNKLREQLKLPTMGSGLEKTRKCADKEWK